MFVDTELVRENPFSLPDFPIVLEKPEIQGELGKIFRIVREYGEFLTREKSREVELRKRSIWDFNATRMLKLDKFWDHLSITDLNQFDLRGCAAPTLGVAFYKIAKAIDSDLLSSLRKKWLNHCDWAHLSSPSLLLAQKKLDEIEFIAINLEKNKDKNENLKKYSEALIKSIKREKESLATAMYGRLHSGYKAKDFTSDDVLLRIVKKINSVIKRFGKDRDISSEFQTNGCLIPKESKKTLGYKEFEMFHFYVLKNGSDSLKKRPDFMIWLSYENGEAIKPFLKEEGCFSLKIKTFVQFNHLTHAIFTLDYISLCMARKSILKSLQFLQEMLESLEDPNFPQDAQQIWRLALLEKMVKLLDFIYPVILDKLCRYSIYEDFKNILKTLNILYFSVTENKANDPAIYRNKIFEMLEETRRAIPKECLDTFFSETFDPFKCRIEILDLISTSASSSCLKFVKGEEVDLNDFKISFQKVFDIIGDEKYLETCSPFLEKVFVYQLFSNKKISNSLRELLLEFKVVDLTVIIHKIVKTLNSKNFNPDLLCKVLRQLRLIPPNYIIPEFVTALFDLNALVLEKHTIWNTLSFIAPGKRHEVVYHLLKFPEICKKDNRHLITKIFLMNEKIQSDSYSFLLRRLNEVISNQVQAFSLSSCLIKFASDLLLHSDHPLFQQAYIVTTIADPQVLNHKKNPYRIFQSLKKLSFSEPKYEIESEFNLHTLRQRGETRKLTIKDLPHDVPSNSFKRLFDQLNKRVKSLSIDQKQCVENYIQDNFANSLNALQANLLEKPLIPSLLDVKGVPDQPIESSVLYIYAILKMLLDKERESKSQVTSPLYPHEELLLKISCCISNCQTGQRDGIAIYYNNLPPKYRNQMGPMIFHTEEKVIQFVDRVIQKVLEEIFASREFLKRILPERALNGAFSQHSHQTLYLKNRLYLQVGLRHQLTFDAHTGNVCGELLDVEPKQLLEAFFKLFTLKKVADQLKLDVSQAIKQEKSTYMTFQEYLEPYFLQEKQENQWRESCFLFTDALEPLGLTDKGILTILKMQRFVNQGAF